jgi:phage recombination protein Bet
MDVARRDKPVGVLAIHDDQQEFTTAQLEAFGLSQATRGEQLVFLNTVQRTGLDPAARQIYMIPRENNVRDEQGNWTTKVTHTIQTGIDGYRLIADRTGKYVGSEEAWTEGRGRFPTSATVTVYKLVAGQVRGFSATAHWDEYVQLRGRGDNAEPTRMWAKMPHRMLAKCAEALALRKAFPQDLSGIYTAEEMAQADPESVTARTDEQVVVGEVVTDGADPAPSVVSPQQLAEQIAQLAARCDDLDKLRGTWQEASNRGLLDLDVSAVTGGQDGPVSLREWLLHRVQTVTPTATASDPAEAETTLPDAHPVQGPAEPAADPTIGEPIQPAHQLASTALTAHQLDQLTELMRDAQAAGALHVDCRPVLSPEHAQVLSLGDGTQPIPLGAVMHATRRHLTTGDGRSANDAASDLTT